MGAPLAWRSEHLGDGHQNSLGVGKNLVVPEPENAPALSPELAVPPVMVAGASMLAAIGFDDQARVNASEIDDVGRDGELASKSPAQAIFAKFFPQHLLCIWHISAEYARLSKIRHAYLFDWAV